MSALWIPVYTGMTIGGKSTTIIFKQLLLRIPGFLVARPGFLVGAVALQDPGLGIIIEVVQQTELDDLVFGSFLLYGKTGLHAVVQVARHPVG